MNDDTAPAELAWENYGGHVLRVVAGTPSSPRATTARVGRTYDPRDERDGIRELVDCL
jgi:hypothetical protein